MICVAFAERARKSPSVRSINHAPPCAQSIDKLTKPHTKANGFNNAKKLPVYVERTVSSRVNGTPRNILPNATPNTNAGTAPPTAKPQSQDVRHLVFSSFER